MTARNGVISACVASLVTCIIYLLGSEFWGSSRYWTAIFLGGAVGLLFNRLATSTQREVGGKWGQGFLAAGIVGSTLIFQHVAPWIMHQASTSADSHVVEQSPDEDALISIATDLAQQKLNAGEKLEWPPGMILDYAGKESDFPPKVWSEAKQRWAAMSTQQKGELKALREKLLKNSIEAQTPAAPTRNFQAILFAGLAMVFAFVPASRVILFTSMD